jgi:lysophospholipase L1-like esterase
VIVQRRPGAVVVTLIALMCSVLVRTTHAHATAPASGWVATWGAGQTPPGTAGISATGFADQTVRMIVHTSTGGGALRIHLSNEFGAAPLAIAEASVGLQNSGATEVTGTSQALTFGGGRSVVIPAGATRYSDGVGMTVPADRNVVVSLYFADPTGATTWHPYAQQVNYVGSGNRADDVAGSGYSTTSSWFYLDSVAVRSATTQGAIVAFGDSITDGIGSTVGANHRWPDDLARRLSSQPAAGRPAVVNAGIGGNRVLTDAGTCCDGTAHYGTSAISRFAGDALDVAGVRTVLLFEGINDIGNDIGDPAGDPLSAQQLIAGYQDLIGQAHARGLTIIAGTLTPYRDFYFYTTPGEQIREQVNHWIRTSRAFDGVVDFDAAIRDPDHPDRVLPAYDSGDHIHLNDAGYQAMANAKLADLRVTPVLSVRGDPVSLSAPEAAGEFTARVKNPGPLPAEDLTMTATAPAGWTIRALGAGPDELLPGQTGAWRWQVIAPAGARLDRYTGQLTVHDTSAGQPGQAKGEVALLLGVIPHTGMSATGDSAQEPTYDEYYAIDDGTNTLWHSQYSPYQPLPHQITVDLGASYDVSGLRYLPRQDGNHNGVITSYAVSLSSDGSNFTQVASGSWADDVSTKSADFAAQQAHYIRLTALAGGNGFASAAEINVVGTAS